MHSFQRSLLEDLTALLASMLNVQHPITDMKQMIQKANGFVVLDCSMSEFDEPVVVKRSAESISIHVPASCSKKQQNFKLAEGLSYAVMEMGLFTDAEQWNRYQNQYIYQPTAAAKEIAEQFAISLLLPKDAYIEIANKHLDGDVYRTTNISDYFNVPVGVVSRRGIQLGLMSDW